MGGKKNVMVGWVVFGLGLCMLDSAAESFPFSNFHPPPFRVVSAGLIRGSAVDFQVCC